jgi:U3 small nucleolar RNA-associated protein 21
MLTHEKLDTIPLHTPLLRLEGFRDAGFVAICGQDRITRIFDISTKKLCRRFVGHSREITDMAFSPDGRRFFTSSMDATVRVYDIPTGRCLSWMKFDAPVMSITISLTGDQLCIAQADKNGVYMYVDRTLYETIHFWREPTEPTLVDASSVVVEVASGGGRDSDDDEDGDVVAEIEPLEDSDERSGTAGVELGTAVRKESTEQRGGSITMSALPKAYWSTLFNLEALKARNKPRLPAAAAEKAPFFLPTVIREGVTPSFPTPSEFSKLQKESEDPPNKKSRKAEKQNIVTEGDEVDEDMEELPSVWVDADVDEAEVTQMPLSRIIKTKVALPRCALVVYLAKALTDLPTELPNVEDDLMAYLKTLSPPSIDAEFRALCLHDGDVEGLGLVKNLLDWMTMNLARRTNFELLLAYLHRLLVIYDDIIIRHGLFSQALLQISQVHVSNSEVIRRLLQSNLCLLKNLANIN